MSSLAAFVCISHLLFSIRKNSTGNTVGKSILTLAALDSHEHDDAPDIKVSGYPPFGIGYYGAWNFQGVFRSRALSRSPPSSTT
jgi:hypothetical protein